MTIDWDQTYARSCNETLHSIVELADGHFLIAGAQYRDKDQIIGSSFAIVDSRGRIVEDMTAKYRLFSISALGRIKSGGIVIAGRATANDPLSIITIDDVRAPLPKSSVVIGTAPTVSAIIELPGGQLAVAGSQSVGKRRVPWLAVQPKPN